MLRKKKKCNWLSGENRKQDILEAAIELAIHWGYLKVTRKMIAERLGIADSLITVYFKNMELLRIEILKAAVNLEIPIIISQAIGNRDPIIFSASQELLDDSIDSLKTYISTRKRFPTRWSKNFVSE